MNLQFAHYSWAEAPSHIRAIRQRVFIDEQRVPAELEWDNADHSARHFLAVVDGNKAAATARLYSTDGGSGIIGRMAVLPQYRGQNVGAQLLQQLIREGAAHYSQLQLSAQQHAIEFYRRAGFHVCSDAYDDAGIIHFDMRCLAPAALATELANEADQARPGTRTCPLNLGADSRSWLFQQPSHMRPLMHSLAAQARQRVWLYDTTLSQELYGSAPFCQLISALARRHRLSDVRLLIHDDKGLTQRRHGLVDLLRRVPSRISLRRISEAPAAGAQRFMLVDRQGVLYRHPPEGLQGFVNFNDSARVKRLEQNFEQMWNSARPSLELRQLSL